MWKQRLREWLSRACAARMEKHAASDLPATAPDPPVAPLGPPSPALGPPATAPNLAAPAPDPAEKFAGQRRDLDVLRKTVEDAAAVSAGFWLSYLFTLFYIGIAAGAVTHKDLLLENPVKLPFLGVDLPLVAFFVLAPIIFIVTHAYTLVHFVMLGAKVGCYNDELVAWFPNRPESNIPRDIRKDLRRQLPSNIFVQVVAGPTDIRARSFGLLLRWIALISLVIGPLLLLLLIQAQFLPYHLCWVTWVHRFAVLADVILLLWLWPRALRSSLGKSLSGSRPLIMRAVPILAALVSIGLAFTVATFPGEAMEDGIGRWPPNPVAAWLGIKDWTSVHDLLFNGDEIFDPHTCALEDKTLAGWTNRHVPPIL